MKMADDVYHIDCDGISFEITVSDGGNTLVWGNPNGTVFHWDEGHQQYRDGDQDDFPWLDMYPDGIGINVNPYRSPQVYYGHWHP